MFIYRKIHKNQKLTRYLVHSLSRAKLGHENTLSLIIAILSQFKPAFIIQTYSNIYRISNNRSAPNYLSKCGVNLPFSSRFSAGVKAYS